MLLYLVFRRVSYFIMVAKTKENSLIAMWSLQLIRKYFKERLIWNPSFFITTLEQKVCGG